MGKRRLEKAIQLVKQQQPDAEFKVHWLPYQLNPAASEEGVNKLQMYNDKFGPARVAQMIPMMTVGVQKLFGGGAASLQQAVSGSWLVLMHDATVHGCWRQCHQPAYSQLPVAWWLPPAAKLCGRGAELLVGRPDRQHAQQPQAAGLGGC